MAMSPTFAMLSLVASMALTGANVPLAKALIAAIPAEALLVLRFALAGGLLAVLVPFEPGPPLSSLRTRQWGAVIVLALVGSVGFTWAVLEGVSRTSGASAGIITATLPAVVALLGMTLGYRPRCGQLAMIALAIAGVVLIQGEPDNAADDAVTGTGAEDIQQLTADTAAIVDEYSAGVRSVREFFHFLRFHTTKIKRRRRLA